MLNLTKLCWIIFKVSRWNVTFVCAYGRGKKLVLKKKTAQGKLGSEKLIVYQQ
jgi:hypothetical protein